MKNKIKKNKKKKENKKKKKKNLINYLKGMNLMSEKYKYIKYIYLFKI